MQQYYGDQPHFIQKGRGKEGGKRKFTFIKLLLFIVIICLIAVIAFSFLPQSKTIKEGSVKIKGKKWYFVSFLSSDDYATAEMESEKVIEAGGSGYIINDGKYQVTASVYDNEKDASAVMQKQSDDASVYSLVISDITLTGEYADGTLSAFLLYDEIFESISKVLSGYEEGKRTDALLFYTVEKERERTLNAITKLDGGDGAVAEVLRDYLTKTADALTIEPSDEKPKICSSIRRTLSEIVYLRYKVSEIFVLNK